MGFAPYGRVKIVAELYVEVSRLGVREERDRVYDQASAGKFSIRI